MSETIVIIRAVRTSIACPAQWDLWDADGNYYYGRYRHGHGEIRRYRTEDWVAAVEDQYLGTVAEFDKGDPLDGDISLPEFASRTGITLAPNLLHTGYGDHLRDGLVMDGFTFLLEGSGE